MVPTFPTRQNVHELTPVEDKRDQEYRDQENATSQKVKPRDTSAMEMEDLHGNKWQLEEAGH